MPKSLKQFVFFAKDIAREGILVDLKTLKKHKHQGFMSDVFTIDSNKGPLIMHSVKLIKEHKENKVWNKFIGLSKLLTHYPKIPTSHILYVKLIGGKLIMAQKLLNGEPAGKRILKNKIFQDKWIIKKDFLRKHILSAIADIHKIQFKKFGWPMLKGNLLTGNYKTWRNFFLYNAPKWINSINKADGRLKLKYQGKSLEASIKNIMKKINYSEHPVLVHGDAINPSNILVGDKNRISVLDWEWSILADPAWEFADLGWWDLNNVQDFSLYFNKVGVKNINDKKDFIERVKLYRPLWLLWGTHMHANDKNPDIYIALRKLLDEKI